MSRGVLRVGVAQYEASSDPHASLERLRGVLGGGARVEAELVVLPEYSDVSPRGLGVKELRARAAPLEEHVFVEGLRGLAAEHGAVLVAGVLERRAGCVYSSVVAVDPRDGVELLRRKMLLFDALGFQESRVLCPGEPRFPVQVVAGLRVGAVVCFELRFPEVARMLALSGAEALLAPAAWYPGPGKEEQLRFLAQARASENTVYLVVADQAPPGFAGRSMVVDPYGHVVLDLGVRPGYGEAVLDPGVVREARERLPVLRLARGLLGGLYQPERGKNNGGGDSVKCAEQHCP